jgi:hypothetical protein
MLSYKSKPGASAQGAPDRLVYKQRPPRQRTLLKGKLIYCDGYFMPEDALKLDCTIHNLSKGGAMITIAKPEILPNDLFLIVVKNKIAYRARIAWLAYPARGLQFVQDYPLQAPLPRDLEFLRKIWSELYVRASAPG